MSETRNFDVIVIGGGPVGLATSFHLAKRKVRALVLEQFTFGNQLGSSAGVSRQFRIPYPERYMVRLAHQALPFWQELQEFTSQTLLDRVGTLWFGDPTVHTSEGNIAEARNALHLEGIPYTNLNVKELEEQFAFQNLPSNYTGLFQCDGASINLQATAETLLRVNEESAYVTLKQQSPVIGITPTGQDFKVTTPLGDFTAAKLVLTPGPYANSVFNLLGFHIDATWWSMASAFYKRTEPHVTYPTWFVFQNKVGENGNEFYGFPELSWNYPGYIRVASDFVIDELRSAEGRTFIPDPRELGYTADWIREHMMGLATEPEFTSTCMVALSKIPNKELLLDFAPAHVPGYEHIVLYATGWAAKFIPILGRILSDLALDRKTRFDIANFQTGTVYLRELDSRLLRRA